MKKTYIEPATSYVALQNEDMIAASLNINSDSEDVVDNTSGAWSNKKDGWNSENWIENDKW